MSTSLSPESLQRLLSRRDLTNPRDGRHALQSLSRETCMAVAGALQLQLRLHRSSGIVRGVEGSPRLLQGPAETLQELLQLREEEGDGEHRLLACLGPVHARQQDGAVRLRGHRLALWVEETASGQDRLPVLVKQLSGAALPAAGVRLLPESDSEFERGFRLDARGAQGWVTVAECGHARVDGRAFVGLTLDLEQALAVRKGLPDVALVHDQHPEVQAQMQDLEPWVPVKRSQQVNGPMQPAG